MYDKCGTRVVEHRGQYAQPCKRNDIQQRIIRGKSQDKERCGNEDCYQQAEEQRGAKLYKQVVLDDHQEEHKECNHQDDQREVAYLHIGCLLAGYVLFGVRACQ